MTGFDLFTIMLSTLLIGGAGFLGSHLQKTLEDKRNLTILGRSSPERVRPMNGHRYIQADFRDYSLMKKVVPQFDEIILLAHSTVPKSSFENPMCDLDSNLPPTIALFDLLKNSPVRRILVVSSGGTVYGNPRQLPICEEHPTNPVSPYGITKLAIEKYALMLHHSHQVPVVIVRPSNPFGAFQLPFRGQGFVANAIACILENRKLEVFGNGEIVRDYLPVEDLAVGIAACLFNGRSGEIYNLGSGVGRTTKDILDALSVFARSRSMTIDMDEVPKRPFDVTQNVLDSRKAHQHTGWKSESNFYNALEKTWQWFLSQKAD